MSEPQVTILYHRTCKHICALVNSPSLRPHLEQTHRALARAGYFQWRVATVGLTDDVAMRYLSGPCDTCRITLNVADVAPTVGGTP
jgi:hypothetical protein